jgi:hypothetical protein
MDFILGVVLGAIFSPILIRLGTLGYKKISKNVEHLEEKHGDK